MRLRALLFLAIAVLSLAKITAQVDKASPAQVDKASPAQVDKASPAQVDKASPTQVDKATPAPTDEASPAQVDEAPYFGNWENDRGDTLQITGAAMQVNNEKPVRYDDITEDSDESFVLQIKDSAESSYFGGNFLRVTFGEDPDHFTMAIYKTLPDTLKQQNEVKHIEWSVPAVEKEQAGQTEQPNDQENKEEQKKDEEKKVDQPKADQSPGKSSPSPTTTPSPSAP